MACSPLKRMRGGFNGTGEKAEEWEAVFGRRVAGSVKLTGKRSL